MNERPLVSVVLPVYNGESLLATALDSLVSQTYPNIEIVAVNNSSTDRTLEILEEYAEKFPQIKIYTIPYEPLPGGTIRYGYSVATGEYLCCCDADDRLNYRTVQWFVEAVQEAQEECDVVVAPVTEIFGDNIKVLNRLGNVSTEDAIINSSASFWGKLIKRDFYLKHEPIPNNTAVHDYYYHLTVLPYARVAYCKHPVYYYYRWPQSQSSSPTDISKMLTMFDGCRAIFDSLPPIHNDATFYSLIRWFVQVINTRWVHADKNIEVIKEHWTEIEAQKDYFLSKSLRVYSLAEMYAALPDTPMPNVVYINGFGLEHPEEELQERVRELENQAFYDGCRVVVLHEGNCELADNEPAAAAFRAGNWEFVGAYCALRKIYEEGGVYLHRRIRLEAPLNYVRYFPSFFARLSENAYSDSIFGGMAGNEVVKSILDTYRPGFYPEPYYPLRDRIRNILVSKYRVPMDVDTAIFKYPTVVFAPSVTLYPSSEGIRYGAPLHFCYHDFSDQAGEGTYFTLPTELLTSNLGLLNKRLQAGKTQAGANKKELAQLKAELGELTKENAGIKKKNKKLTKQVSEAAEERSQLLRLNKAEIASNKSLQKDLKQYRKWKTNYKSLSKWKKFVILLLADRKELRAKLKKRLRRRSEK